jgi:hypothetical protein
MGALCDLNRHLAECKDTLAKHNAELFPDRKHHTDLNAGVSETRKKLLASGKLHELFQELNQEDSPTSLT